MNPFLTARQWLVWAKVVIVVREMVDTAVVLAPVVEKGDNRVEQEEEEEKQNERFLESHIDPHWVGWLSEMLRLSGEIDTAKRLHVFAWLTALRSC